MFRHGLAAFLPLAILIAIPLLLRPDVKQRAQDVAAAERLVIITPHSESLRYEFGRAFRDYYRRQTGREIRIEWRTPGGTSDIVRFIADRFESAFRQEWLSHPENGPWTAEIAAGFINPKAVPGSKFSPAAVRARQLFLHSDIGIGIDLFFGGGQFDQQRHADRGYAVDAGMQRRHPEWFTEAVIPQTFSGETFYDVGGRYYGVCLASFGICRNPQRMAELPFLSPPEEWQDLGNPRWYAQIAIADPTKTGSVNKCFEMMVQQQMANAFSAGGGAAALDRGWADGINLIKRLAANSRYVTDSAGKVPHDVAGGGAAAGICIDFYGRSEAEWTAVQNGGKPRMEFVTPVGGSSVSADPIQLLRGAPDRAAAVAFIEFTLSEEGQKLWAFRPGTPGGPKHYALRRTPIRKDLNRPEYRPYLSDPEVDLYRTCAGFRYHPEWTGRYFNLLRILIRCIALDPLPELQDAWRAIARAGGPTAVPQAMAKFNELPFAYHDIEKVRQALSTDQVGNSVLSVLRLRRAWTEQSRRQYREAAQLARAGK